ncbi:MAG: hypothetical protein KDD22_05090, partial [Bdellovibrionales bacterium]|nr:hypothetical protein [Bdellovibrionales bacterium]
SPDLADVLLSVQSSQWILTDPLDQIKIPHLLGGQQVTLPNTFKARIKNSFQVGNGTTWTTSDTIVPLGRIPRIQRTQRGLSLPRTLQIGFPVEITPLQSVYTIGPGETASFQWRVTNTSNSDFKGLGGATRSLNLALGMVQTDSPINPIESFDFQGNAAVSNKAFLKTLTELKAKNSVIISGQVKFSDNAVPYTSADFESTLGLELIGSKDIRTIMTHQHRISIAQTYRYSADASALLITNSNVGRKEYESWLTLAQELGLKFDVWDLSYQNGLNLAKDLSASGQGHSLLKNYAGKTIVVLNTPLQGNRGLRALQHLDRAQFYEAGLHQGINFFLVGGEQDSLAQVIATLQMAPNRINFQNDSPENFLKATEEEMKKDGFKLTAAQRGSEKNYEEFLSLIRRNPRQNVTMVLTQNVSGQVEPVLYPGLSQLNGNLVALPAGLNEISRPGFLDDESNIRPFLLSLSMETKLAVLKHLVESGEVRLQQKYMTSLSATLIHEIVESLYVQNSLSKGVTESSDLKRLRSYAARTGELLQSHSGDLGVYMNGHVARICAAVSTFAEISQNKELKQLWLELYQPLKKSKAFESEYIRYQAAFKQFADARKDGLRAS